MSPSSIKSSRRMTLSRVVVFPTKSRRRTKNCLPSSTLNVKSILFWPGTGLGGAAFYAYAYPGPAGFNKYPVQPKEAYFHDKLGEFILPYEAVRIAENPTQTLLQFLQTTYEAAATLAALDRAVLERKIPQA